MNYTRISSLLFFTLLQSLQIFAQADGDRKNLKFSSQILKEEIAYNLYLPANYQANLKYPVIYFLHWFGADQLFANTFIKVVDSLVQRKKFPEVIIISPAAKNTWYLDDYAGKYKYASMFIDEFLPYLKGKYSITTDPKKTAIMGYSMGGFGALRFTMLHPEIFGSAVSFMAGISTKEQIALDTEADYNTYHQQLYGSDLKPQERANDYFLKNNPLYIAQNAKPESLRMSKWYIQSCDNDYHSLANSELHVALHQKNIEHEFRVMDGTHDLACVNGSMADALEFIKRNFSITIK